MRIGCLLVACLVFGLGCDPPADKTSATATSSTAAKTRTRKPPPPKPTGPPLLNPAAAKEKAPDKYKVQFDTTKGKAVIEVTRAWSPGGADRFYNLVKIGYYNDVPFYRVTLEVAQFGINPDPKVTKAWDKAFILDEMVRQPNHKGMVTFARRTSDTRTTHVFINLKNNANAYDDQGFAPFGKVVEGMDVILKLSNKHGERPQQGDSPKRMKAEGAPFIKKTFPKLDYIKKAAIL